jgi:hypothetical protein
MPSTVALVSVLTGDGNTEASTTLSPSSVHDAREKAFPAPGPVLPGECALVFHGRDRAPPKTRVDTET